MWPIMFADVFPVEFLVREWWRKKLNKKYVRQKWTERGKKGRQDRQTDRVRERQRHSEHLWVPGHTVVVMVVVEVVVVVVAVVLEA